MIIVDTGFWLALANSRDQYHGKALLALERLDKPLITTMPVLTETCHLLLNRLGNIALATFLKSWKSGAFSVYPISDLHASKIEYLCRKYADLPMDLADASLVLLAEELGSGRILSTDQRDFQAYRWKNTKPFENILLI